VIIAPRRPLRLDVRQELLQRLIRGSLPVGGSVNEAELAEELGVSRTPLREALLSLEAKGLLEARPGRGWHVAPLTSRTVQETYPIICALEQLGVRSTDPVKFRPMGDELGTINQRLASVGDDAFAAQQLDDEWHRQLLSECGNDRLIDMIASSKVIVHRYEYAYMSEHTSVPQSVEQHDRIATALARGDIATALTTLELNWRSGMDVLCDWLESFQA
jgi:DNA-binding GntR family transcriptional regulator